MKSCHFYRIAQCSSKNFRTLSSFSMTFPRPSMTFVIIHDFPGLENDLPKFHDFPWREGTLDSSCLGRTSKKKQTCTHYMYRWKTVGGGRDKRRAGTERVVQYQPHAVCIQLDQLMECCLTRLHKHTNQLLHGQLIRHSADMMMMMIMLSTIFG